MESTSPADMSPEEVLTFLKESLPATILTLHDISSKRRHQARKLIRGLARRTNDDYKLQEALVSSTVACLAGASEAIRAGVVECLGLYAYTLDDCEDLKLRFLRIVLLLDNHTPQMARSAVKFLRLAIQGITDEEALSQCFQYFVRTILNSEVARCACRIRIRTLVEKLGKRFGWMELEKKIPERHMKLFRYTKRMYHRRVRDCQAASKRKEARKDASDDDSDNSSDDEEEVCLREGEGPADLTSSVRLVRKPHHESSVKLDSEGRLVVSEEQQPLAAPKRLGLNDLAELRDKANALKKSKTVQSVSSTRQSKKEAAVSSKRMRRKHEVIGLTQFAPRKQNSFGDAKKGDTDPYAYMRLNPSLVREKYKGNALESISRLVRKTGEKASKKKGRNGVAGNMFVSKPIFKKPLVVRQKKNSR